jgi:FMN-dependent NADH-azoreductase
MWNFGIPSSIKVWIDHVVRAGRTFNYIGAGVEGLVKGKKAILALASGGVFSEGPWKSWDTVEPYLRQILGFIGIDDVQTVRAEGMNIPPLAVHAVPMAKRPLKHSQSEGENNAWFHDSYSQQCRTFVGVL